jgi:hypothetical protein
LFTGVVKINELKSYDEQEKNGQLSFDKAKKLQFRLLGPLGKGHNIVVHIRSSAGRTAEWKELVGRMIPMDNCTRWNSWFIMLKVLLKLEPYVVKYCIDHREELKDDILTYQE